MERDGSATVLNCRMNQNDLLDSDGFAPFKIASAQEALNTNAAVNVAVIAKTHEDFGLSEGIQFQRLAQSGLPMNLLETQVPRILIIEGVNDIVPIV